MENDLYVTKIRIDKATLWKDKIPRLSKLDVELTERCNNNCIHCYINLPMDDHAAMEKELPTEEVKRILKEAAALGCLRVRYTGGEPLLRKDFEELYLYARKLGLKVLLFTNATLITPQLVDCFTRVSPLIPIEVTVYGMKRKSYEAVTRNPGSYEAAWRGMNLLLEKKVPFIVKMALLPPNKEEIDEFEAWAFTIPWVNTPRSYSMFFELRCRRDSESRNRLISGLRFTPEEGLKIIDRNREYFLNDMRQFCSKFMGPTGDKLFVCGSGVGMGCVDAYGFFQPCIELRHPDVVYDLRKGSLKNALTDFFPKIRQLKAVNPDYLARCARCFLKGLCEQCPARSWTEHGTLDTPVEYLCEVAHAKARYIGLLEENEYGWEVEDWQKRVKKFAQEGSDAESNADSDCKSLQGNS